MTTLSREKGLPSPGSAQPGRAEQLRGDGRHSARGPWQLLHRNRLAWLGIGLLAILLIVALTAPWLAPYDPRTRVGPPFTAPNAQHWLGTNDIGQDILSELIYGTRLSLFLGVAAAFLSLLLSVSVGMVAGFYGGTIGSLLMRLVDLVLAFPFLPFMIVLAAYLGQGVVTVLVVITVLLWAGPARIIRAQVLATRQLPFVTAAHALGARPGRILFYHLLPAVVPLMLYQFIRAVRVAILLEASLSFLGLGDPTQKSWGTILYYAHARGAFLTDAWQWWVLPPGLCIVVTVLAFALTGLALEQLTNPRLQQR